MDRPALVIWEGLGEELTQGIPSKRIRVVVANSQVFVETADYDRMGHKRWVDYNDFKSTIVAAALVKLAAESQDSKRIEALEVPT